jgi:amino acid transporter
MLVVGSMRFRIFIVARIWFGNWVQPVGCLLCGAYGHHYGDAAVSYGELSAMFPKAGGQYVYIKEAYGKW